MITQIHNKLWVNFDNIANIRFETLPVRGMTNKQVVIYQNKDGNVEYEDDYNACHLRWQAAIKSHNHDVKNPPATPVKEKKFEDISIMHVDLSEATKKSLRNNKIKTLGDLMNISEDTLTKLPGVGMNRVRKILEYRNKMRGE